MYSREFRSGVFPQLSFPPNSYICNLLAIILDYIDNEQYNFHEPGPVVTGMIKLRKITPTERDYLLVYVIYKSLQEKYLTTPLAKTSFKVMSKLKEKEKHVIITKKVANDPNAPAEL